MSHTQFVVTAVVVSYNRAKLLGECLDGLAAQTRPIDRVVVVDNASDDGALDVARAHPLIAGAPSGEAKVVALSSNVGGAGGFCAGVAEALSMARNEGRSGAARHYVWLMDDDTVPTAGALAALLDAAELSLRSNRVLPVALGSKAVWTDGREHLMNKPMERTWARGGMRHLPGGAEAPYQVRSLSFVSCLLSAEAIERLGRLPRAAYFLWNDDFEFTSALLRRGVGYYVPSSMVVHKTRVFGSSDADPGARFYNEVRNKLWLFRFSRANFNAVELAEFLLKTARRWVLTWLRAKDRALIADCFKRGWHDGMKGTPPSNVKMFAGEPEVARAIAAVEHTSGRK